MAQFTFTLQELESVEGRENLLKWFQAYDLKDFLTDSEIAVIRNRGTWTEEKLAKDILQHYYIREIGLETPALFKLKLESKMHEIMEEKAPLLYSMCLEINPLDEFEIKDTTTSHELGTTNTDGTSLDIHSVTPQGEINKADILTGRYASTTDANESQNNSTVGTDGNSERTSKGHNTSQMNLIREYRDNIVAFNRDVINDLAELFLGIYG